MKYKNLILFVISIITSIAIFASCSEDEILDAVKDTTCDLNVKTVSLLVEHEVTYKASKSGSASFTTITYLDEEGNEQTVAAPELPWSKTITMPANKIAAAFATGIRTTGTLTLQLKAVNNMVEITDLDECSGSSN